MPIGSAVHSDWIKNNFIIPSMLFEMVAMDTNFREMNFAGNIAVLEQGFRRFKQGYIIPSIMHIIDYR